jgi:hypothetical protein
MVRPVFFTQEPIPQSTTKPPRRIEISLGETVQNQLRDLSVLVVSDSFASGQPSPPSHQAHQGGLRAERLMVFVTGGPSLVRPHRRVTARRSAGQWSRIPAARGGAPGLPAAPRIGQAR